MNTTEHLRNAIKIALRNWPVILINLAASLINCAGFVIFVLLPVSGLLLVAGISPFLITDIYSHEALLEQIPWVVAASVVFMLLYITVIACIGLFVLSATVGVIVDTIGNPDADFSLSRFFSEGKRLFLPYLNYTAVTGGIGILMVVTLSVAGVFVDNLVQYLKTYSATLSYFVGIFSMVVGAIILLSLIILLFAVTFYGLIEIAIGNEGTMEAFRRAVNFVLNRTGAVGYFLLSGFIYIAVNLVFGFFGLSFRLTPFGFFLSIPFQFVFYLISAITGLWFLSALVSYYLGCRG